MRVYLLHGMGRTRASMAPLAWRLRAAGHRTRLFGYGVARESLEQIASRLVDDVNDVGADEIAIVGHSLGNIITRLALPRLPTLTRFVMLAPPNQSPIFARTLRDNPLFRALTTDAGACLADPAFYAHLPVPTMPSLILAGTSGLRLSWWPAGRGASDGVVLVDEARLPGIPLEEVPCVHTFIMNDARVVQRVLEFLQT